MVEKYAVLEPKRTSPPTSTSSDVSSKGVDEIGMEKRIKQGAVVTDKGVEQDEKMKMELTINATETALTPKTYMTRPAALLTTPRLSNTKAMRLRRWGNGREVMAGCAGKERVKLHIVA